MAIDISTNLNTVRNNKQYHALKSPINNVSISILFLSLYNAFIRLKFHNELSKHTFFAWCLSRFIKTLLSSWVFDLLNWKKNTHDKKKGRADFNNIWKLAVRMEKVTILSLQNIAIFYMDLTQSISVNHYLNPMLHVSSEDIIRI